MEQNINLDKLMNGAVKGKLEHALAEVFENILDINTDAKKQRKVVLTLKITPNENRDIAEFEIEAKTNLATHVPVTTTVIFGVDSNGNVLAREHDSKIAPGQIGFDGKEQSNNVFPLTQIK